MSNLEGRQKRFGEWLTELRLASPKQIEQALVFQKNNKIYLGEILVQQKMISESIRDSVLSLQKVMTSATGLVDMVIDPTVIKSVPEHFARQNTVLPLLRTSERLIVAMPKSNDINLLDQLELLTGLSIYPVSFRSADLSLAVDKFYGAKTSALDALDRASKDMSGNLTSTLRKVERIDEGGQDSAPVVQLVNSILMDGIDRWASDIHFEPYSTRMVIRYRIDGVLMKIMEIPKNVEQHLISRIKVMSDMNITERRRPQDGRFSVEHKGGRFDFRVATVTTLHGEKINIRIIRSMNILRGMESLGMTPEQMERIRLMMNVSYGVILTTGPTGSGKSTTLYAALEQRDKNIESIITIEDPVEYPVDDIQQIPVSEKVGMTFANSLRHILRQDPDTIMIGEIRDSETLETAINAALTGHLVLSTIHTNDAASSIARVIDMGAKPYLVAATIKGIIAQRLLRRICQSCIEEYKITQDELEYLRLPKRDFTLARGRGCEACNQTGYKGRLAVFEMMVVTKELQEAIARQATTLEMRELARKHDMKTLFEDARDKALKWRTTTREINRVLGHNLNE